MEKITHTVFEYLNISVDEKLELFMNTRSELSFLPSYWINFNNVDKNIMEYDSPDLYTLDYLIGKSEQEMETFFKERPHLLLLIPKLLGIRDNKFEKPTSNKILKVQGAGNEYSLSFKKIDMDHIDLYLQFIKESGLSASLRKGLKKSVHDYAYGVEAGMDSNGRKNRSGDMGEAYLEAVLKDIANKSGWIYHGQTLWNDCINWYDIKLDENFKNRKFDGSLYNPSRRKLYLFEINNFNSNGSKSKAVAGEFKVLHDAFSRTNHDFIYITDGKGWDSDKSHLREAMQYIGKVFNYKMIENGYLDDYLGIE